MKNRKGWWSKLSKGFLLVLSGPSGSGKGTVSSALLEKNKEITVPDVTDMTVEDAIAVLTNAGLVVEEETSKMVSSEIEVGNVIKTDPLAKRKIKKGRKIVIWESLGEETFTIDDYVGKNYIEIKTRLETAHGLIVEVLKKEVTDASDIDKQAILEQKPSAGTTLKKGDQVTLYIADVYEKYPDFVKEKWTVSEVEAFAKKYGLRISLEYIETSNYADGSIVMQSRKAGTEIMTNATLLISVAKDPNLGSDNPGGPVEP